MSGKLRRIIIQNYTWIAESQLEKGNQVRFHYGKTLKWWTFLTIYIYFPFLVSHLVLCYNETGFLLFHYCFFLLLHFIYLYLFVISSLSLSLSINFHSVWVSLKGSSLTPFWTLFSDDHQVYNYIWNYDHL